MLGDGTSQMLHLTLNVKIRVRRDHGKRKTALLGSAVHAHLRDSSTQTGAHQYVRETAEEKAVNDPSLVQCSIVAAIAKSEILAIEAMIETMIALPDKSL
jgi:hypothetical protein